MKNFLYKTIRFSSILILLILVFGVFLPTTPRASKSLFFSKKNKDYLLKNVESPRIILIGGSNLSLGINSKMIKDSLDINPINTGINAAIGLIYMMDSTLPYIQSGDIVVVISEYANFYGQFAYGDEKLLRIIMDVSPSELSRLRKKQWINIISHFPRYAFSKLKITEYFFNIKNDNVYTVDSFNEYGDIYAHWKLTKRQFSPYKKLSEEFNFSIINELYNFKKELEKKGAFLFVSFPGLQSATFKNQRVQIMRVEAELKQKGFYLLGDPERYMMPESLMFDTPYHLLKKGVDYRTQLLIDDLKNHEMYKRVIR